MCRRLLHYTANLHITRAVVIGARSQEESSAGFSALRAYIDVKTPQFSTTLLKRKNSGRNERAGEAAHQYLKKYDVS